MSKHSFTVVEAETQVSGWAREIAAKRATVLGLLALVLAVCVGQGWIDIHTSEQVTRYVTEGLGFAGTVGAGLWIRKSTTTADPKLQPRSTAGELMQPVSQTGTPSLDHLEMADDSVPSLDHLTLEPAETAPSS